MREWSNAELKELNIENTANIPTSERVCDDFQDGFFLQGDYAGSGPSETFDDHK